MTPGRALVLGSGRGHDALAFARAGWTVTGVDFSAEALAIARRSAAGVEPAPAFVEADIFHLSAAWNGAFDLVVEYVTYCAIAPYRRAEFAAAVSRLLAPGGRLLALFFPVEERPGGPPFGVDLDEAVRLFSRHLRLLEQDIPMDSVKPRSGREVLTLWRAPEGVS
jgi:SAM-dependent methyltransferase